MRNLSLPILAIACATAAVAVQTSCSSTSPRPQSYSNGAPKMMPVKMVPASVVKVRKTIVLNDETFDMKGREYRGWVTQDSQAEGGRPLFRLMGNATLKNGVITNSQEGVWFDGHSNRLENVQFPNVFEDATTNTKGAKTATGSRANKIVRCAYWHAEDKAIQQNYGELEVWDSGFKDVGKAVRQNGKSREPMVTRFHRNTVIDSDFGVVADGRNDKARVHHKGNSFVRVKRPFWVLSKSTEIDEN